MKKHIILYALETIVLIVLIIASVWVYKLTRVQKVILDPGKIEINEGIGQGSENTKSEPEGTSSEAEPTSATAASGQVVTQKKEDELSKEKKAELTEKYYDKYDGLFNIALFGVDSREGDLGKGTRSDSIMVCSIDMNTHEVKLISVFRDTYLKVGKDSYNKCNAAYAIGGPEQALSMLNTNLDLNLSDYVTIGFEGLIDAIDALGGVPIDVQEEEIFHLNNYQLTMADELGMEYKPVLVPGMQMLNGIQATAYCRIRYVSGGDFKRAERQRNVITAMLGRTKAVPISSMTAAATAIFPNIATSLDINDVLSMLMLVSDYEVTVSDGFPFSGMRNAANVKDKGSCVIPTSLNSNVKKLHKVLFNEEDYHPSEAVKKYSIRIEEDTAEYIP